MTNQNAAEPLPLVAAGVNKEFTRANGVTMKALDDVSLEIEKGEMIVLLGPSGCGKTTLLRCVAGLEYPDSGTMTLGGRLVYDRSRKVSVPANRRDINMMFQTYALWPHLTLVDNVAYPLRVDGVKRPAARARALEYLELVGIGHLGTQYPSQVSGGQQQRAALARTLVAAPSLVLFDEPLSNVDAKVRVSLRAEISRLHHELGFAALYVTHDQSEALALGDRVAVMNAGRIAEFAAPTELYSAPRTRFVAEFLGSANVLTATILEAGPAELRLRTESAGDLTAPRGALLAPEPYPDEIAVMWRPENSTVVPAGSHRERPDAASITGIVSDTIYAGTHTDLTVALADGRVVHAFAPGVNSHRAFSIDDRVAIQIPFDAMRLLAA
jgi:ABC-type Fe3+/spermidine/putrescine transport system ATPase subunit